MFINLLTWSQRPLNDMKDWWMCDKWGIHLSIQNIYDTSYIFQIPTTEGKQVSGQTHLSIQSYLVAVIQPSCQHPQEIEFGTRLLQVSLVIMAQCFNCTISLWTFNLGFFITFLLNLVKSFSSLVMLASSPCAKYSERTYKKQEMNHYWV